MRWRWVSAPSSARVCRPIFEGQVRTAGHQHVPAWSRWPGSGSACLGSASVAPPACARRKELPDDQKKQVITEFNFFKGAVGRLFAGVMSACMAFALAAGKPIAAAAVAHGTPELFQHFPVLIVVLAGGFTTNVVWCLVLNVRNRSGRDYVDARGRLAAGQLRLLGHGGCHVVLPVLLLQHGHDEDGPVRLLELDHPHGFHHRVQQPVGAVLPRVERFQRRTRNDWSSLGLLVLVASTVVVGIGNWLASRTS